MGFRIHPIFTSLEQETLFKNNYVITQSMWDDIFPIYSELGFHTLFLKSEITYDIILVINDYLKSIVCKDEFMESFEKIDAFVNASIKNNITWTIY